MFGEILDGEMVLNEIGEIAKQCWLEIPNHFPHVQLHEYVIMPNHVPGIVIINDNIASKNHLPNIVGAKNLSPLRSPKRTIRSIVRGFKIGVTKWFRHKTDIYNIWQRNYYEHIIRNDRELEKIRQYIINNPFYW